MYTHPTPRNMREKLQQLNYNVKVEGVSLRLYDKVEFGPLHHYAEVVNFHLLNGKIVVDLRVIVDDATMVKGDMIPNVALADAKPIGDLMEYALSA